MIIWESANSYLSYPLEVFLEESKTGYKIYGDEVAALQPYAKIMRQDFSYQKSQEEKNFGNDKGAK